MNRTQELHSANRWTEHKTGWTQTYTESLRGDVGPAPLDGLLPGEYEARGRFFWTVGTMAMIHYRGYSSTSVAAKRAATLAWKLDTEAIEINPDIPILD